MEGAELAPSRFPSRQAFFLGVFRGSIQVFSVFRPPRFPFLVSRWLPYGTFDKSKLPS